MLTAPHPYRSPARRQAKAASRARLFFAWLRGTFGRLRKREAREAERRAARTELASAKAILAAMKSGRSVPPTVAMWALRTMRKAEEGGHADRG